MYQGVVTYISPFLNSTDYSLTVRADLSNAYTLRYSSFGKVEQIIDPNYKFLAIPQNIAQTDSVGFFIKINIRNIIMCAFRQTPLLVF